MRKRNMSLILSMALIASMTVPVSAAEVSTAGSNGTSVVSANVANTTLSVTVPMELPVAVDSNGEATFATNTTIENKSFGPIVIKDVSVTGQNGWVIDSYDTDMTKIPAGTKRLGFSLNNCGTDGVNSSIPGVYQAIGVINGKSSTYISYEAKIPPQTSAIDATSAAKVIFTTDWFKGTYGTVEPGGEVEAEPTYTVGESYSVQLSFDGVQEGEDSVTWSSSNELVATVEAVENYSRSLVTGVKKALVTIVGPGECQITATLGNGYSQSLDIKASPTLTGIDVIGSKNMTQYMQTSLNIVSIPENSDNNIIAEVTSSDENIISIEGINPNCVYVQANGIGTATLTFTYKGFIKTFDITVESRYATMKDWTADSSSDYHDSSIASQISQIEILEDGMENPYSEATPDNMKFDISADSDGSVMAEVYNNKLFIVHKKPLNNLGNYMINNTNITSVNIPSDFNGDLDGRAFAGSNVMNVFIMLQNDTYKEKNGILFNYDYSELVVYPCGRTDSTIDLNSLSSETTSIGDYAFYNAVNMKSVKLGDNITEIGNHAFECIPKDYSSQYPGMPLEPVGMEEITFGNNLNTIGDGAFKWTCITMVNLPESIQNIGTEAFANTKVGRVEFTGNPSVDIGRKAFQNIIIHSITIPNSVKSIATDAFDSCKYLTTINYTGSLTGYPWGAPNI